MKDADVAGATLGLIGSWSVDLETGTPAWSDDFYRVLGLDPGSAEPGDELFLSVIHEDDRPGILEAMAKLREDPAPISMHFRIRHADGGTRRVRGYAQVAHDADGRLTKLLGALEDVSATIDAAHAVESSERQLRAITASALDAMVTFRFGGEITGWNPAASALFGYEEDQILGRDIEVLVPERLRETLDQSVRRVLMASASTAGGMVVETSVLRSDGAEIPVEVTLNTWDTNGEPFITGFVRDISKRRHAEQRLEREHRLLSLLEAVAVAANASDRLDRAAADVLGLVCRATGWELGHVLLVDDGRLVPSGIWNVEVDPDRWAPLVDATADVVIEAGQGVSGLALATRAAQWVESGSGSALCPARAAAARTVGLRSAFGMPVLVGEEVAAVLELFSATPGDLSDVDFMSVMGAVGTQLGRVVERERAALLLQERTSLATLLSEVRNAFVVADPWADALDHTCEAIVRVLGAETARIWLSADAKGAERGATGGEEGRSLVRMPLLVGDEVVGVLGVESGSPLSPAAFETLEVIGHEVAQAVVRRRAVDAQEKSESRFRAVVEKASEIVSIHGPDAGVLYVSPSVEQMLGHHPDRWLGSDGLGLIHPADRATARLWFVGVLQGGEGPSELFECRLQHADGTWRNVEAIASNLLSDPAVLGVVMHIRDVTRQRAAEAELAHARIHDPLTGLPMRRIFHERLERALTRAERQQWSSAVLSIDVDQLRDINDRFGHDCGDRVLVEVARRLTQTIAIAERESGIFDVVARAGSDEFYLLVEDFDIAAAQALARRVQEDVGAPLEIDGEMVHLTIGVGVAIVEPGERDGEAIVAAADTALRIGKEHGVGTSTLFEDKMRTASSLRTARETALRFAIDRGEFRLLYQPKVSLLRDQVTGVEALLRWEHPQDGPIPPLDFIPHAEASGLIVPIGSWILREACAQAATWAALRPDDPISVSVNVSARQFDAAIVAVVDQAIQSTGVDPRLLCLEVTESVLMTDTSSALRVLRELKVLGISISVDDFGTGYSSLAYLKRFPIDELKIDRAFVSGLGVDPEDTAIVAAVVAMAHALDIEVVAEGVETSDQLRRLRSLGSDMAQGFLFARAQPSAAIDALLDGAIALEDLGGRREPTTASSAPVDVARVLIVDDSEELRGLARLNLSVAGFETEEAGSVAEALDAARRTRPTCVLVDIDLGAADGNDGLDLCRALRGDPATAEVTIVVVTSSIDRADRVRAFALGADDYIVKPFSPRDLLGRVRAAMARSAAS
ncbi:MAG TPA: EAL domain-containing protein [Acidimicrobiales bacterium]|nr:EAL domain-containing protein [Acidimicrobiales bacterium]